MILMFMIIFLSSLIFLTLNHPLTLGGILLIQTIMISLISGMMNYNYWFSYIMFLIMIGGMLILFIYMTSVASNEKFKFNSMIFYLSLMFIMLIFSLLMFDWYFFNLSSLNYDMMNQSNYFSNKLSMNKYFNMPSIYIMITLIIYLLITLIAIVKITEIHYGPMRQKN